MKIKRNSMTSVMNKRHVTSRPHKNNQEKRANNPKRSWKGDL